MKETRADFDWGGTQLYDFSMSREGLARNVPLAYSRLSSQLVKIPLPFSNTTMYHGIHS
jgi:hypothetical protein